MNGERQVRMEASYQPSLPPHCRICGVETRCIINVNLSPISICDDCCRSIALQVSIEHFCKIGVIEDTALAVQNARARATRGEKGGGK